MLSRDLGLLCWSNGRCEFVECGGQPEQRLGVDCQLVMATTQVLDGGVPTDHYARRAMGFRPRIGLSRAFSRP